MSSIRGGLPSNESSTVFQVLPGQFPSANNMKTQEFLNAASGVVNLIERFGKCFAPVIYDMNGNIRKINAKYEENQVENVYLEDMILRLRDANDLIAIDALQWLRRGIHFINRFFELVVDDTDSNNNSHDLSPFIKNAYRETLDRYHGWLGAQLFNILSRFVPNRRQFIYTLALESTDKDDQVINDMRNYAQNMSACVQRLINFYQEYDLETNDRA